MVIHPNKRHKGQIILIRLVSSIKDNITESFIAKAGLTIRPEQSLKMVLPINQILE
jgi:hypothetical protein